VLNIYIISVALFGKRGREPILGGGYKGDINYPRCLGLLRGKKGGTGGDGECCFYLFGNFKNGGMVNMFASPSFTVHVLPGERDTQ